jgi:outer membrane lipoprotein LolB
MINTTRCGIALAFFLLAACAGTGPHSPNVAPAPAFDLSGRVAARYQERVFSSALRWKQTPDGDEIWLSTPLGQAMAHLRADADGAILTAADQRQYRASSIESLTRSALGWAFPVGGLRYWVRGVTAPGMSVRDMERDEAGRIVRFRQDALRIEFSYADSEAIRISRIHVAADAADIRLVIDSLTSGQP